MEKYLEIGSNFKYKKIVKDSKKEEKPPVKAKVEKIYIKKIEEMSENEDA